MCRYLFEGCRTFQQNCGIQPRQTLAFYRMPDGGLVGVIALCHASLPVCVLTRRTALPPDDRGHRADPGPPPHTHT